MMQAVHIAPRPDVVAPSVFPDPMLPLNARLISKRLLMPDHMLFRIRLQDERSLGPDGSNHIPGQFVMLSVIGIGEVPISICHAPEGDHLPHDQRELNLTIRRVGRVTNALFDLSPGDLLGLRGPYGRGFPFDNLHGHSLVMMAGGLGMAPLRSLLQYAYRHRERFGAEVHLLYGARNATQLLYLDELHEYQQSDRLDVHLACDQPPAAGQLPTGLDLRQGNLLHLLDELPLDAATTRFAVCGPPVMYGYITSRLRELQIPPENIYVSLERRMECAIGKCGHCAIGYRYTCTDGPVFSVWEARGLREAWQPPKGKEDPYLGGWR
jgi:NAD(P)H-flavin reductase